MPRPAWPLALALLAGCLPYPVTTTAKPVAVGEVEVAGPVFVIPGAIRLDTLKYSGIGFDLDARIGLSPRSDIGFRIPTFSGVVVSYKHLLTDPDDEAGLALMPSAGFLASHGYADLGVITSGPVGGGAWYGGLRGMATVPLADSAKSLPASIGGFVGLKVPTGRRNFMPELGLYYGPAGLYSGTARVNLIVSFAFSGSGRDIGGARWPR